MKCKILKLIYTNIVLLLTLGEAVFFLTFGKLKIPTILKWNKNISFSFLLIVHILLKNVLSQRSKPHNIVRNQSMTHNILEMEHHSILINNNNYWHKY